MADSLDRNDVELMRRLASGDEAAFLEFYRRHQGGVYRFVLHMTGSAEYAADVVQETFLILIRQAAKFDVKKGPPAAFLYGIARNRARKLRSREGRYAPLSGGWDGQGDLQAGAEAWTGVPGSVLEPENVLDGLERQEAASLLREAILTLPEHYREPVTLCDLEGKSYEEASALLDCPVGTVRSRLNRARAMLVEKLRPLMSVRAKSYQAGTGGKR